MTPHPMTEADAIKFATLHLGGASQIGNSAEIQPISNASDSTFLECSNIAKLDDKYINKLLR